MPTEIGWTDETWNPTVGCSKVSPGCDGCYAINVAARQMQPAHEGLTIRRPGERVDWTGEVRQLPDRLETPFSWRRPRRVFVDSMSDLFHPKVDPEFIIDVWATMAATSRHTYQVLTKRPQRIAEVLPTRPEVEDSLTAAAGDIDWLMPEYPGQGEGWLPNVWLGTSIEEDRYTFRARHLLRAPAAKHFLSLEPLLGPLPSLDLDGIDWVIVGGESGPGARPMHPSWVRDIRDRCVAASVPFFFKQWGGWVPVEQLDLLEVPGATLARSVGWPDEQAMVPVGKKAAGRELDGRTWDEVPG